MEKKLDKKEFIVKDRNFSSEISAFPNKSRHNYRRNFNVLDYNQKVKQEIEKKLEKEVQKEIKKIPFIIYEKTKSSALEFRKEFRVQVASAITAAFAFLIALSWRTPIENMVNNIIKKLNLSGSAVYIEFLTAIIVTFIAVLFLILFSRWNMDKGEK